MNSSSKKFIASVLTGLATGFTAISGVIDDPLLRFIFIGSGSFCATLSIYLQFGGGEDEETTMESRGDEYMKGLREGVSLGKEITESGGTIPPTLQSNPEDTEREMELDRDK